LERIKGATSGGFSDDCFYRVENRRGTNYSLDLAWVVVSNAHNEADNTGYGAVNYDFRISKYEVNNSEYCKFLNAVDPSASNKLWLYNSKMATDPRGGITNDPGRSDGDHYVPRLFMYHKPVNFVSFWDAARFANWLHNGCGSGGTGTGAYDLYATNPDNGKISRSPCARYFIPNEDEWYKAAYAYNDGETNKYHLYPTENDSVPAVALCTWWGDITNDADNVANYNSGAEWNNLTGNLTGVGSGGSGSESYYGAADMAGNVYEWNEAILSSDTRGIRGGCWYSHEVFLQKTDRQSYPATYESDEVGFRIGAAIPLDRATGLIVEGGGDEGGGGGDDDYPPPPG